MLNISGHQSNKNIGSDTSYTTLDPGPYVAIVKQNVDPTRMGRLKVVIPALAGTSKVSEGELISVEYAPPFYGAKSVQGVNATTPGSFQDSQHSYGMWMVPPDIDSRVLVIFAEGKISLGYWIACVQEPFINNMTPGIAASEDTYDEELADFGQANEQNYGTGNLPAGEINRKFFSEVTESGFDRTKKPVHPFSRKLRDQGLVQDNVRGTTTSSARRETPSNVFGISTPGPIDKRVAKKDKVGPNNQKEDVQLTRKAGHTFVMDDGDANGNNHLVRLRTSSGHQLLMHDTAGVMYLANSEGTVWMEFSNNGLVDVYAQTGYNLRSGADINFHAEGNINMYANKNIKIKANESTGGVSLDGSRINALASDDVRIEGRNVYTKASTQIIADAGLRNIQQGMSRVDLIGGQVHFNSFGTISNLIPKLSRTNFLDPVGSGTGTASTNYPDVTLKTLGNVLKVDRALPGMSGMRVPTHEPFWGHQDKNPAFGSVGGTQTTAGSVGFVENENRNSDLASIKWAQYRADLEANLEKNQTTRYDNALSTFNLGYSNTYSVDSDYLTSGVSGYSTLPNAVSEMYQSLTGSVNTGGETLQNVLINESGGLYTENTNKIVQVASSKKPVGTLNKVTNTVNTIGTLLSDGSGTNVGGSIIGVNGPVNTLNNVSKVTNTYKNVVGGKVTSVVQTAEAVSTIGKAVNTVGRVAKSIGKVFGF